MVDVYREPNWYGPEIYHYDSPYIYTDKNTAITEGCIKLGTVTKTKYVSPFIKWRYSSGSTYSFYICIYQNQGPNADTTPEIGLSGTTGFFTALHSIEPHNFDPSCRNNNYPFNVETQKCEQGGYVVSSIADLND